MSNRTNQFVKSLLTGYGSILASIIYTIASIPLALHYLGKEEFGLWALALQVNGYLGLLDLGMSSAVGRFLADHKDNINGGEYGSLLLTGGLVFVIQGASVASLGYCSTWIAPSLFAVPSHLSNSFAGLLALMSSLSGISIAMRSLGAPLWAFHRMDVINLCSGVGLLLTLPLMWLGFKMGWGVYSFTLATVPPMMLTFGIYYYVCKRNKFYPDRGRWGSLQGDIFRDIFHYGKDVLLIALGSQMVNASQIIIISRMLGLKEAAMFSIVTKLFSLSQQVLQKILESAAPGLTELYTRGDLTRLLQRYKEVTVLTLSLATIGAVSIAVGNATFVRLWTSESILWNLEGDAILAILVITTSLSRCFMGLAGITKSLTAVRILYFVEGVVFVPLAILSARPLGLVGVLGSSLLAHLATTAVFSVRSSFYTADTFKSLKREISVSLTVVAGAVALTYTIKTLQLSPIFSILMPPLIAIGSSVIVWIWVLPESLHKIVLIHGIPKWKR